MTIFLAILAILLVLILWYVLAGRAWLKTKSWAQGFFSKIEPIEIALFRKSETILVGRMMWLGGGLVGLHDSLAIFGAQFVGLDWMPVTSRVLADVPEDMRGLVITAAFTAIGLLINWLRKRTTMPIEVVAASDADSTPKVAAAVAAADSASDKAVAAVTEAKAS